MARLLWDARLDNRTARLKLRPRGLPYYRAIEQGLHLGYRRNATGGRWVVRRYVPQAKGYVVTTVGAADDLGEADGLHTLSFAQAQERARELLKTAHRAESAAPAAIEHYTVGDALNAYCSSLEARGQHTRGNGVRNSIVFAELLATRVKTLAPETIRRWRDKIVQSPPRLRSKRGQAPKHASVDLNDPEVLRRRQATANRCLTVLKAALNYAWRDGKVESDMSWRRVEAFGKVTAARPFFLLVEQARDLIEGCDEELRPLVQAALLTGARYGELAALNVGDFIATTGTLHVRRSKSGKSRDITLTDEGVAFFTSLLLARPREAPLLLRADGSRWGRSIYFRAWKEALKNAGITMPITFHGLRHTWASLSIMNGMPLVVVAHNLGHADTRMVEKHYGHLTESFVAETIRRKAPQFGITPSVTHVAEAAE